MLYYSITDQASERDGRRIITDDDLSLFNAGKLHPGHLVSTLIDIIQ